MKNSMCHIETFYNYEKLFTQLILAFWLKLICSLPAKKTSIVNRIIYLICTVSA